MAKKAVKKKAKPAKTEISPLTMLAAQAGIPWEYAVKLAQQQNLPTDEPDWETAVAGEHARLCHLWAEAMIRAGQE